MDGGITKIGCDCIPAILRVNALEVLRYFIESFIPSEPLPTSRCAAHGIFQPVLVIVKILQGDGLRADVSAAEWVVFVTADVESVAGCNCDFDTTYRFAKVAAAVMRGTIGSVCHGAKSYPQITPISGFCILFVTDYLGER